MENKISISWIDLTLEFKSIFSKNKIILHKLNGCAKFGSLTAVMGPSGAGLTSLLKCLNGMNNSYLSDETKILLNSEHKIRSTFIGDNEKDFLIMGLTAKQNMIYASKLKNSNCGQGFDHQNNVRQVMSDLMISDTLNTKAMNCSGGEQKRLAIALELTALNKPNLILFDEPTTGLDSNVAEVVIMCLKELAVKKRISIITTIHQPNSDILQMFDSINVLAKGGVCVYSGSPQHLSTHLNDCNINYNENQVPIETLITIGSKGIEDTKVIELMDRTTSEVKQWLENQLNETKEKRIIHKNKRFYFKDIYLLMGRKYLELISYGYRFKVFYLISLFFISMGLNVVNLPKAKYNDDCIYLNQTNDKNCIEMFDSDTNVYKNINVLGFGLWIFVLIQNTFTITEKIITLSIFTNEHQNKWYSSGVYYLTETIFDFIAVTIGGLIFSITMFFLSQEPNDAKRFWPFIYVFQLSIHAIDGYSHFVAIILIKSKEICFIIGLLYSLSNCLFSSFYMSFNDMSDLFKIISHTSIVKFGFDSLLIIIYGLDRCPANKLPKILIKLDINDDHLIWEKTSYILLQLLIFRFLSILSLLFIKNSIFEWILKQFMNKFKKPNLNQEIDLNKIERRIFERSGYENQIEISLSEEIASRKRNCKSRVESYSENEENNEINENNVLSIAWIDMTLKIDKTFYSDEKLILRGIKGFIGFDSLTALMGPSGAGKTSLLKCLNGMYRNFMTTDSKIYLSKNHKISTCFIAQDQREHIMNGLTVKQSLIYASKLKNTGKRVDHEMKVNLLMEELAINEIKNNGIEKCSSGQQKRVVMAMELTAEVKPNLICVDEPTSGVDSYSALLMIECFKRTSKKHNLSIITSIHQPNLEVLMIFDMIYALAKGGVCIYSGRPQNLRTHLKECQIICRENQTPIEILLKIGAKGYTDETVLKLTEKTSQSLLSGEPRVANECKLFENGIPIKSKKFSLQQMWYLFLRMNISIFRYNWIQYTVQCSVYLMAALFSVLYFDFDLEGPTSCVPKSANICQVSIETIEENKILGFNTSFIIFTNFIAVSLSLCFTALSFGGDINVFFVEFRNFWYSTESYLMVKVLMDLIPNLIIVLCFSAIISTQYERENTFPTLFLTYSLMSLSCQSIAYICVILLGKNALIGCMSLYTILVLFAGLEGATERDFVKCFVFISNLNPLRSGTHHILSHFYAKNQCSDHQISSIMYKFNLDYDSFEQSLHELEILVCFYFILAYICLKLKVNWDSIQI